MRVEIGGYDYPLFLTNNQDNLQEALKFLFKGLDASPSVRKMCEDNGIKYVFFAP
jgi:hypothetical protein